MASPARWRARAAGLFGVCAAAACQGRPLPPSDSPASGPALGELDLSGGDPEAPPASFFGVRQGRGHTDLVLAVDALPATDVGVLVKLGGAMWGLARAEEVGRRLRAVRDQGKPVVCHADDWTNASLMLGAMGCSELWVSPAGGVDTIGIAAQLVFANRLLNRLGIDVDFLQIGKYKGASEPFTRDAPSPEARESLQGTLTGLRAAWLDGFAAGRPQLREAEVAVESGPYSPLEAKERGLVDQVGTYEEAKEAAKARAGAGRVVRRFGSGPPARTPAEQVLEALRDVAGSNAPGKPHVAVVVATGSITMGGGGGLPGGDEGIRARALAPVLARLAKSRDVKAVVLRIDSPGGSVLASDLLWKELRALRDKKPLVTSVGGMAASGGYYLACASSAIVAERSSIVGSIGVVGGKLGLGSALEELGVHVETVAASPDPARAARATYLSPFGRWDDGTRERVRKSMQSYYDLFLARIADGRGVPVASLEGSTEGRIFAGTQAFERKMIDELGGVREAIARARSLAGLPDDAPVHVLGDEPTFGEQLLDDDRAAARSFALDAALSAKLEQALAAATYGPALAALPELGAFVALVQPLAQGERVLAAAPYVLTVR